MNIDRHNYEMYFLLYVDNELSAEDRNAVEQFVAENNDLASELKLLQETALPSEKIVFSSKQDLYKNESTNVHLQEAMLLHLDNELAIAEVNALSAEMAVNDDLKREWNILKQTKLDPAEKIIFENKELLYRHEKHRVVPMFFWRAAAAVFIAGTALFIGLEKFSGTKTNDSVATTVDPNQQPFKKIQQPKTNSSGSEENSVADKQTDELASAQPGTYDTIELHVKKNSIQQQEPGKNTVSLLPVQKNNLTVNNNGSKAIGTEKRNNKSIVQKETNKLPVPYFENINNQDRNKTVSSNVQDNIKSLQDKTEDKKVKLKEAIAKTTDPQTVIEDIELTTTNSGYAKTTALNSTDSETGNNSILFISEDKVNRSKFGGFLKKVKRVITRNANIQSGNSVKIAGFEVATR
ncbi:MAG: hypothetical protein ABIN36_17875 [Ferruginibacter sp.]